MSKGKITAIFVHGDNLISNIIQDVTSGYYAHVATKLPSLGYIVEAEGSPEDGYPAGVRKSPIDKYDNDPNAYFIDVNLPNIEEAEAEALRQLGNPYSFYDCLAGGMYDLYGIRFPGDGTNAYDCSKSHLLIVRAGGINLLPDEDASHITPMDDERAEEKLGGENV